MSSKTLQPFPAIPLEIKGAILSFCDAATLANASSVSLAFLQLASPLLYDDINIELGEQTEKLFCARVGQIAAIAACLRSALLVPRS